MENIHEKSLNSLLDKFADSCQRLQSLSNPDEIPTWKNPNEVIRAKIQVEVANLVRMAKNSQRDYDNNPTEDTERLNNHWYL